MIKKTFQLLIFITAFALNGCQPGNERDADTSKNQIEGDGDYEFPYQDPEVDIEERIDDLISRMTLEEKVSQMMHSSPAIERLGVPTYNWWNESLHGHARAGRATVFPQAIGMASSFDEDLLYRVSTAISDEARAFYHAAVEKGNRLQYGGLTFWTPNVNIFRDPRWGRGQETYGEDPYLMSRLGVNFVKGLQGDNPDYLKAAACAKHYVVHSGPEALRHEFDAIASEKDMFETYLPAFEALVKEAKVEAVMCAYNRTNGEPCCGSPRLLTDILRKDWDFQGHVVSDCWALVDIHTTHGFKETPAQSAAYALKGGVNLNCGSIYDPNLLEAVEEGLISEADIDSSLAVLLRTRFKLGLFDPPGLNPYEDISTDVINSEEHQNLAREAGQKSLVLLKNKESTLPLDKNTPYVFVTGPNANNADVLLGNYYGVSGNQTTILEGIAQKVTPGNFLQYKQGFLLDRENINPIDWTTDDAQKSDVIIAVMGIAPILEGEEGEAIASPTKGDRPDMSIPQNQVEFLKGLREGYEGKLVTIITGGSPMNLQEVLDISDALIFAWYPGEEGGNAVADIIFGDAVPSGRLPITFPKSLDQLPPFEDYDMTGRTYRYMTEEPLFPFGFGLSYTSFSYSDAVLDKETAGADETVNITVTVTNEGEIDADEVVQLYITDTDAPFRVPLFALKGIKRISLAAGESKEVTFAITPDMLKVVDMNGESILDKGIFEIHVGGSSPVPRAMDLGAATVKKVKLTVS